MGEAKKVDAALAAEIEALRNQLNNMSSAAYKIRDSDPEKSKKIKEEAKALESKLVALEMKSREGGAKEEVKKLGGEKRVPLVPVSSPKAQPEKSIEEIEDEERRKKKAKESTDIKGGAREILLNRR